MLPGPGVQVKLLLLLHHLLPSAPLLARSHMNAQSTIPIAHAYAAFGGPHAPCTRPTRPNSLLRCGLFCAPPPPSGQRVPVPAAAVLPGGRTPPPSPCASTACPRGGHGARAGGTRTKSNCTHMHVAGEQDDRVWTFSAARACGWNGAAHKQCVS